VDFWGTTLAINSKNYPQVQKLILELHEKLLALTEEQHYVNTNKSVSIEIYQISTQLFRLTSINKN